MRQRLGLALVLILVGASVASVYGRAEHEVGQITGSPIPVVGANTASTQGQLEESTIPPPAPGASIDSIEVYVHLNDRYPSLHRVAPQEFYANEDYYTYNIYCTGSMLPTLSCHDEGYAVSVEDETVPLAVGDIVTYLIDDELADCFAGHGWDTFISGDRVLHRIIEVVDEGYRLQGDNNDVAEPCLIPRANIIGLTIAVRRPIDLSAISDEHMREIVVLYFTSEG